MLSGSGRVKLDDAVVDLRRLDALRVAPAVRARSRPARTASSCSCSARAMTGRRGVSGLVGRLDGARPADLATHGPGQAERRAGAQRHRARNTAMSTSIGGVPRTVKRPPACSLAVAIRV